MSDRAALHKELGNVVADRFWKAHKEEKPGLSFQIQLREFSGCEMKCFCLFCGCSRKRGE